MQYKTILFDLDGTITASGEGIIQSVRYALNKLKLPILDQEGLYSFIGPPLNDTFKNVYHLDKQTTEQAVSYYREYYQEKGMYENHLYEGILDVLTDLKQAGCSLYIATSKPEIYAKQIVAHFNLDRYFVGIYGASLDGERSKKSDVIRYALNEAKITQLEETLMIGDRSHDIIGAKENHLASLGVLYGFGDLAELEQAGADYIAATPKEIEKVIIK
ncbi:hydrolase [Enterococcus silesiacus]|uniref:Hydrolase n=1 Tax=Enterococcus silesiacus TaxID=332949 RepID=A0A0S3KBL0_9ENTE|nr:HAD family hydrolase [Enterococcus silesiacus]ALS01660.1 hydrolase [Enterococcus silesiacus]OJG91439.1 HAD hydrolase, family IA [Enterococcus silesiacus]